MLLLNDVAEFWQIRISLGKIFRGSFNLCDVGMLFQASTQGWTISRRAGLYIPLACSGWLSPVSSKVLKFEEFQDYPKYVALYGQACRAGANFSQLAEIPYTREYWIQSLLISSLCGELGNYTGDFQDDECRDRVISKLRMLTERLDTRPELTSRCLVLQV